jgi:hypothetical protein
MRRARHSGYTLIEALLSIGIGVVIVYTAYAAMRAATLTTTVCNRLSIENRLMMAGIVQGLDSVDYWSDMDRDGWQPCRTTPSKLITGTGGYDSAGADSQSLAQPFTPFAQSWAPGLNQLPAAVDRYDPTWLPNDPKTWYRGDGSLWLKSGQSADQSAWGNYGLFSGSDPLVVHGAGSTGASTEVGAYQAGFPAESYTWYADQQKGLKAALGFYGWWDYIPANALIDWYDRDSSQRAVRPYEMANRYGGQGGGPVSNIGQFAAGPDKVWASGTERPLTRSSYLYEQVLAICAPRPAFGGNLPQPADDVNNALRLNRWMGGMVSLSWEFEGPVNRLMQELTRPVPVVPYHPTHWPNATVDVRRYRIFARTITQCFVRMIDPLKGSMVEMNFRVSGTNLRGARLQRGLDD